MSQLLNLKISGLHTSSNNLSEVPEGALSKAVNVVIDKDSIAESRRGFERCTALGDVDDRIDVLTSYKNEIISHNKTTNVVSNFDGTTWTDYSGTYSHPDSDLARIKFAEMNGNKYFTSSTGIKMLDNINGPIYSTGVPKGLDGEAALSGASGFMANNAQIAYRIVWGTKDASNNLYLGVASQRIIISNSTGGTRDVSLTFTVPAGISTGDFYQIYRSAQSASSSTEPNDELQLVYEANPTSGEISAKSITLIDLTPDSLRGAFLYSNANQEGIAESNNPPPFAKDICVFKNFMFFADIKTSHYLNIKLLGVGGSALVADDTITIDGVVFTAKTSETIASGFFKVFTGGSASQNIDDTARSLVKVINQYAANTTFYAYYVTGYSDLPGQILIERRDLNQTSFNVTTSRAAAFELNDGTSDNGEYPHGLMWSKIQQPEHVPSAHLEFVGNKEAPIRRILALRDSLFILKDDGIWRLTGNNGAWTIDPLDTSTRILAPESAVVLNNQIFALTDQGIATISDIGVAVISRPIEDQLNHLIGINFEGLKKFSFGVSYETDRKYILWTVTNIGDTVATQAFVYNIFTRSWTQWLKNVNCGFINKADNKLYVALSGERYVLKERKNIDYTDFIDEELLGYSIVSYVGSELVLNSVAGLSVGDLIYQNSTTNNPITAISPLTNTVTVRDNKIWTVGSCSIFKSINCEIEWQAQDCENPGIDKHFQQATFFFRKQNFLTSPVSFYTDLSGGYVSSNLTGTYGGGLWGATPFGEELWGGISRAKPLRCFIPREKSRGSIISIKFGNRQGFSEWSLQGLSLEYNFVSERVNRN